MIKYALKSAFRNIFINLRSSAINMLGLAIGIITFFILLLYVKYEHSYDSFLNNADNIYRIQFNRYQDGELVSQRAMSTYAIGPLMKESISEVKEIARGGFERCLIYKDEHRFRDQELLWADSTLLKVLPFEIVNGSANGALDDPYETIISESMAKKFFGNDDPIGKQIYVNEHIPFYVTAVFKDLPQNSHMDFKLFLSLSTGNDCERWPTVCGWGDRNQGWGGAGWLYTYVTLQNGADYGQVENKIIQLVEQRLPQQIRNQNTNFEFKLQPIRDIHLHSNLENELKPNESKKSINLVLLISVLVLIIAWINYINISSTEAFDKAKNSSIRKLIGATKSSIFWNFILETFIQNILAVAVSILILFLTLPFFNSLTLKPLSQFLLDNSYLFFLFPALIGFGTVVSGIFPAFLLSSFKPIRVLSGKLFSGIEKFTLKKILIQFQLVITFILIVCVMVVFKQIKFMQTKDLGYTKEHVLIADAPLTLNMDTTKYSKFKLLQQRLLPYEPIHAISCKRWGLGMEVTYRYAINMIDGEKINEIILSRNTIDHEFTNVYQTDIIAGRNFSENPRADRSKTIINQSAVNKLGFISAEDAIGRFIKNGNGTEAIEVIGVMNDIHQESLRKHVRPSLFFNGHPRNFGQYGFKISSHNVMHTVDIIKKEWNNIYPDDPINYYFLDNYINQLYNSEVRYGRILSVFTILAILISCLGLFGLILITIKKNIKQIGVRKVNGAQRHHILFYFLKDYLLWNITAFIIGIPIGLYLLRIWLTNYMYKTEINWWVFALACLVTSIVSISTISYHSWRAANRNPVEALRYE